MVLRIFDPLTGKHVEITVPDSSPSRIPAVPAPKSLIVLMLKLGEYTYPAQHSAKEGDNVVAAA